MKSTILLILACVLILLLALNHVTIIENTYPQGKCSQTTFGCCPDGVNSKVNYYGTNCPGFNPAPYPPAPKPPGGCAGTRYGCCPDGVTPKFDAYGSNCSGYNPSPPVPKPPGGCAGTRYGCCPDGVTPKFDAYGSNCK